MMNLTHVTYFTLAAYFDTRVFKHLFFLIVLCLYVMIIVSNVLLIVVICMNRSLHEPMYLFLCSLFVNELYGSTGLFPLLLTQILSDIHTVSVPFCYLQIYCVYTYANIEICNLAVMSFDRYIAICCPLQYNTRMTTRRAFIFIAAIWLFSFVKVLITLSLHLRLTMCGNVIDNVACNNYLVAKLACSNSSVNNIWGIFGVILTVVVPLVPILFSYMKILKVCFFGCKQTRQKALSTCSPHLASLLNFSFGCMFETIQSRFDMSAVPRVMRIMLSLYFLIIQPLLNPIMFGLQMTKIRHACKNLFCHNKQTCHADQM